MLLYRKIKDCRQVSEHRVSELTMCASILTKSLFYVYCFFAHENSAELNNDAATSFVVEWSNF